MSERNTPDYSSPDFERFKPWWAKADACLGGTEAMRAAGSSHSSSPYLPQFPHENDDTYAARLAASTFFPAYGDTLDGVAGTILRKPIRLNDNVPLSLQSDAENIDRAGTHYQVFADRLLRAALHYGAAYVLVEMPRRPEGVLDQAQAAALDFRPFWLCYSAAELANWPRYVVVNGAPILQQIVFRERAATLDGFGEASTDRYRVWRVPVAQDQFGEFHRAGDAEWEIWEQRDSADRKQSLAMIDAGVSPLLDIPVAVLNANPAMSSSRECDGPLLLDLANLNIKLYQQESDHENNLHLCTPIPYSVNLRAETGVEERFAWGPGLMFHTDADGRIDYAEPRGTGLAERREWMAGLKQQMLELGLSLAVEGSQKGGTTATEAMLRAGRRASRLTQIARALQDCLELALQFHAQWKGEATGGEVTLGVSDADLVLSAQDLASLSLLQEKGQISLRTFWATMTRGGWAPDDFDPDLELEQIAEERARLAPPPPPPAEPEAEDEEEATEADEEESEDS